VLPHSTGPRVGLSGPSGDGVAFPWRYWLPGEPSVSAYKPAAKPAAKPAVKPVAKPAAKAAARRAAERSVPPRT
jgi:hypothetical protein